MISKKADPKIFCVLGLNELESRVLSLIFREPLTLAQLSKILKSDERKIYRILVKLDKKGLMVRRAGFYSCPPQQIMTEIKKMRKELNRKKQILEELESLLNSSHHPAEGDKNVR